MSALRCPSCSNRIVQKAADGVSVRSQGRITIGGDGVCRSQCFHCKASIVLPLELNKAAVASTEERFVIDVARRPAGFLPPKT